MQFPNQDIHFNILSGSIFTGQNNDDSLLNFSDYGNLELWLDGSDPNGNGILPEDNSSVALWVDKSGNGNNAAQVGAAAKPTFIADAVGSLGSVHFDGTSDNMVVPFNNDLNKSTVTILAVVSCDELSTNIIGFLGSRGINGADVYGYAMYRVPNNSGDVNENKWVAFLGNGVPVQTLALGLPAVAGQPAIFAVNSSNSVAPCFTNNLPGTTGTYTGQFGHTSQVLHIGSSDNGAGIAEFLWKGYVHEILIYSNSLSVANQLAVTQMLASKWGISLYD